MDEFFQFSKIRKDLFTVGSNNGKFIFVEKLEYLH